MNIKGGCYCGAIRYEFEGDVTATFQCHCRECQYFTGGHANAAYVLPQDKFTFVKGSPARFCRSDLQEPIERFFALIVEPNLWRFLQKGPLRLY